MATWRARSRATQAGASRNKLQPGARQGGARGPILCSPCPRRAVPSRAATSHACDVRVDRTDVTCCGMTFTFTHACCRARRLACGDQRPHRAQRHHPPRSVCLAPAAAGAALKDWLQPNHCVDFDRAWSSALRGYKLRHRTPASDLRCREMQRQRASLRRVLAIFLGKAKIVKGQCFTAGATRRPFLYRGYRDFHSSCEQNEF